MAAHPETAIHIAVVQWLRVAAPDCVVFHPANGELRDKRQAAKLKAMGVLPGAPDLIIICPFGRVHFLEVKSQDGVLSAPQKAFRDICFERKIKWAVVRSIDDAREALRCWGVPLRDARAA